ncbi:MAG: S4 domain-containing protein [Cellvibrionales bacterium]|nr:S4 domain-containing protein [Cellvibrionales bacterium]
MSECQKSQKIRLDKWLWAARFYKTRSLAKQAIEGGHVYYDGSRVKVSKEVIVGATLRIKQGWDEKTVEVVDLSDKRQSAPIAQTLYQETAESLEKRQLNAEQRRQLKLSQMSPDTKPDKKSRRLIQQLKQKPCE